MTADEQKAFDALSSEDRALMAKFARAKGELDDETTRLRRLERERDASQEKVEQLQATYDAAKMALQARLDPK